MPIFLRTLCTASLLGLIACSSGGSDRNDLPTSAPQSRDYSPDASRQLQTASDSTKLYVEQDFSFHLFKRISLEVVARDIATATAVNIYDFTSLPPGSSETDTLQPALVMQGFTDQSGYFQQTIEVPTASERLLVELNAKGFENRAWVDLDTAHVQVTFPQ